MNTPIVIAFATDVRYKIYTGVAVYSLIQHCSPSLEYQIIILEEGLTDEEQQQYQALVANNKNVSIRFVDVQAKIDHIGRDKFITDMFSHASYYRLFLPEILPEYDKVIYLDSDIIVKEDIARLWNVDTQEAAFSGMIDWAVQDSLSYDFHGYFFKRYIKKTLHIKNAHQYINSGVVIMNLRILRMMEFCNIVIRELNTGVHFQWPDQDIINRVFEGKVKILSPLWNVCPMYQKKLLRDAYIIHYAGMRPWISPAIPNTEDWWACAKKSPFCNQLYVSPQIDQLIGNYYCIISSTIWRWTAIYRNLKPLIKSLFSK